MKTATKDKELMLSVLEDLYEITHEATYLGAKFDVCIEAFGFYLSQGHLIRLKRGLSMLKDHYEDEIQIMEED
tara:strand:+ start:299 stop:517 length:219 start_codon:yes stop_codon:yes gene_type:complete